MHADNETLDVGKTNKRKEHIQEMLILDYLVVKYGLCGRLAATK